MLYLFLSTAVFLHNYRDGLTTMPGTTVGFENHLNYFHQHGRGLTPILARGLAGYLNATLVDSFFRQFNGHTQVNATDLRNIKYPSRQQLEALGEKIGDQFPIQYELDQLIKEELLNMPEEEAEQLQVVALPVLSRKLGICHRISHP